jgi:dolichyl-phosphate beta-glucosyltransferase
MNRRSECPDEGAKHPSFLVTIPAFNEASRLPPFLDTLLPLLNDFQGSIHVQIVDDGSAPGEKAIYRTEIEQRVQQYPQLKLTLLELPHNVGKGGAILSGWRAVAEVDFYLFLDADGAVPAVETTRLMRAAIEREEPVSIFASRVKMLGRTVQRSPLRHVSGRLFAFLVGRYINSNVYDSQCGLKILPGSHFKRIDKYLQGNRFAFDVELLAAASAQSLTIEEAPIDWFDVPGSKVSLFRDSVQMFRSVHAIHQLIRDGYYSR